MSHYIQIKTDRGTFCDYNGSGPIYRFGNQSNVFESLDAAKKKLRDLRTQTAGCNFEFRIDSAPRAVDSAHSTTLVRLK